VDEVLDAPLHPCTRGLLGSVPKPGERRRRLAPIPGRMPSPLDLPAGCGFAPRCERAHAACTTPPPLAERTGARAVRCVHPLDARPA
jgi:peptide/nickel transport system ATP-binding protein